MKSHSKYKVRSQIHGALLIDKPSGITSHDVVDVVRTVYNTREVGHAGTLDPLATGQLICLLGEATKLSQYVMSEEKTYRVSIQFGLKTDSGDVTGKSISEKCNPDLTKEGADHMFKEAVKTLTGRLELPVPKYSAVKVAGKKLYEYARANQEVEIPTKEMIIKSAEVVSSGPIDFVVDLNCEKGTYVRSWVEKLGQTLQSDATVKTLRRLSSGPFSVAEAIDLEKLKTLENTELRQRVIPLAHVLGGWTAVKASTRDGVLIKGGQIPRDIFTQVLQTGMAPKGVRILDDNDKLLALVVSEAQKGLRLARVFTEV